MRNMAVVAVASSTAPGVCETWIPGWRGEKLTKVDFSFFYDCLREG